MQSNVLEWFQEETYIDEVHVDDGKHDYVYKELIYEIHDLYPLLQDVPEGCEHVSIVVAISYCDGIDWETAQEINYVRQVPVTKMEWVSYAP